MHRARAKNLFKTDLMCWSNWDICAVWNKPISGSRCSGGALGGDGSTFSMLPVSRILIPIQTKVGEETSGGDGGERVEDYLRKGPKVLPPDQSTSANRDSCLHVNREVGMMMFSTFVHLTYMVVRSSAVFTAWAVSSRVDLASLPELRATCCQEDSSSRGGIQRILSLVFPSWTFCVTSDDA